MVWLYCRLFGFGLSWRDRDFLYGKNLASAETNMKNLPPLFKKEGGEIIRYVL